MLRSLSLIALALLMAGGCASGTPGTPGYSDPFGQIAQFTTDDLTAALADAQAHNDVAASTCYSTLLAVIPTLKTPTVTVAKGAFSLLQIKRDLLASGGAGANALLKTVNIGCAALANDELYTAGKIGVLGGGALLLK